MGELGDTSSQPLRAAVEIKEEHHDESPQNAVVLLNPKEAKFGEAVPFGTQS